MSPFVESNWRWNVVRLGVEVIDTTIGGRYPTLVARLAANPALAVARLPGSTINNACFLQDIGGDQGWSFVPLHIFFPLVGSFPFGYSVEPD